MRIKDEEPIALIEKSDYSGVLEFPIERLRKELALKELDKFGRVFVSKYVRPSPKERWYLTRGFMAYVDNVRMARLPPLKLIPRLVSVGETGKFWSNYGRFNESPLKFRDGNTGTEVFRLLERYGPYDLSDGRRRRKFDELLISIYNFSKSLSKEDVRRFYNDLVNGLSRSNYPGLSKLFKLYIPPFKECIVWDNTYEFPVNIKKQPHIVIIITELSGNKKVLQYKPFKQKLTRIGVPCQFVLGQNIVRDIPNQKYSGYLRNLALNIYAKIGGIPWILGRPIGNSKCFIGLASIFKGGKVYFSTQIFNSEGLWLGGRTICAEKERYQEKLLVALKEAINLFTDNEREKPSEVIIHKAGETWDKLELAPINSLDISKRVVSVKKIGFPRMYDIGLDPSFMVSRGTYVQIDSSTILLASSGAPHMIEGTQRPLTIDIKNQKVNPDLVKETSREIFLLSLIFSGYTFAVTSEPITTCFARKSATLSAKYDTEENPSLHGKAWFL
jgi:argonaute-like protein implicated in RNA metabolism and viral defense